MTVHVLRNKDTNNRTIIEIISNERDTNKR